MDDLDAKLKRFNDVMNTRIDAEHEKERIRKEEEERKRLEMLEKEKQELSTDYLRRREQDRRRTGIN